MNSHPPLASAPQYMLPTPPLNILRRKSAVCAARCCIVTTAPLDPSCAAGLPCVPPAAALRQPPPSNHLVLQVCRVRCRLCSHIMAPDRPEKFIEHMEKRGCQV